MRRRGVFELPTVKRLEFESMVTFAPGRPMVGLVNQNAARIATMADETGATFALVDVPMFMVSVVERELILRSIVPMYPWGQVYRYSVESEIDSTPSIRAAYKVIEFIEIQIGEQKKKSVGS